MTWEEAVEWLKSQPGSTDLIRDAYYDEPALSAAGRFASTGEWEETARILGAWMPGKVLDLGAGNGVSSYAFACSGCRVVAVEPDASLKVGAGAIGLLAREARLDIGVVRGYAEQLPFHDGSFDIVYGRQVLHHAEDLRDLCREAARVLRSGGAFVMTREHVISKKSDLPRFLESHPLHALYGGENAFLLEEYREAIESAGLRLTNLYGPHESPINYFPKTRQDKKEEISEIMGRYIGALPARVLCSTGGARRLLFRILSMADHTPGRLYSFMAVRERNG
jgi:SAM-dependent methyltransferase